MTKFIPFHLIIASSLLVSLAPSICLSAQDIASYGRFVAYDNGIVLDTKAGLEWYAGPDKDTKWHEAKRWVESLNIAGGGWRMPTIKELKTLYQEGTGTHNMTTLLKTTGGYVWSGEIKKGSPSAQGFLFDSTDEHWGFPSVFDKRGFAVRSRK